MCRAISIRPTFKSRWNVASQHFWRGCGSAWPISCFLCDWFGDCGPRTRFAAGVVTGICTGFVAFAVTSVFHYNLGEEPIAMALFFGYGLAVALDRITTTRGSIDAPLQ